MEENRDNVSEDTVENNAEAIDDKPSDVPEQKPNSKPFAKGKLIGIITGAVVGIAAIAVALALILGGTNNGDSSVDDSNVTDGSDDGGVSSHTHTPTAAVRENEISVTCTSNGSYDEVVYCSVCNTVLSSNAVTVYAEGHIWEDNTCTECGMSASKGLEFELSDDETYYILTGIGTCTDTDVIIPSTYNELPVTEIDEFAFISCESLTSIEIPDSVTCIGGYAFEACSNLANVVIGDSVIYIRWCAFNGCSSLKDVVIPDSVYGIGEDAFRDCSALVRVVIGDGVSLIAEYAFSGCDSLESITVSENNLTYKSIDGSLYDKNATTLIQYATGKTNTSFIIPNSVTSIEKFAFMYCSDLTGVVIPDSVVSIGLGAFSGCDSLADVYYTGTEEKWNKISGSALDYRITIHYNYVPEE